MVKIKINRKKEKRRDRKEVLLLTLLFFILFPYIISSFSKMEKQTLAAEKIPGQIYVLNKKIWGGQKIPLEEYLTGMMAATIPAEYEPEVLKAQAIILRSFCMNNMKKEGGEKIIRDDAIKDYYFSKQECEELWGEKTSLYFEKMQTAVYETKGIILVCNGDIVEAPFSRMSNGKTRDITEYAIRRENYGHMKTVVCSKDEQAKDFVQYMEISKKEFGDIISKLVNINPDKIQKIVLYRDSNNYVKEIQIGEEMIDGEKFREAFDLVSSSFSLDQMEHGIEIQTKGIGHGFGFSQYEANQLAMNGKDYIYLLNYFFDNITFEKV